MVELQDEERGMLLRHDRGMLAVLIALDIAFHGGRGAAVSAADIAERLCLARRGMEPLLQALARAGVLESLRGPRGGYRLGRSPRDIRLGDILAAAHEEPDPPDEFGGDLAGAVVIPLWSEMEAIVGARFASLTLHDLLHRATEAGLRRPVSEAISFAI